MFGSVSYTWLVGSVGLVGFIFYFLYRHMISSVKKTQEELNKISLFNDYVLNYKKDGYLEDINSHIKNVRKNLKKNKIFNNIFPMIGICRDELTNDLSNAIELEFGKPFLISGLGGVISSGITGIKAGMSHLDNKHIKNYVFFIYTHIGAHCSNTKDNQPKIEFGKILRKHNDEPDAACGALLKCKTTIITKQAPNIISDNETNTETNTDPEYNILLRQLKNLDKKSTELEYTSNALDVFKTDLENIIKAIKKNNPQKKFNYVVVSGVLIHYSYIMNNKTYIKHYIHNPNILLNTNC